MQLTTMLELRQYMNDWILKKYSVILNLPCFFITVYATLGQNVNKNNWKYKDVDGHSLPEWLQKIDVFGFVKIMPMNKGIEEFPWNYSSSLGVSASKLFLAKIRLS